MSPAAVNATHADPAPQGFLLAIFEYRLPMALSYMVFDVISPEKSCSRYLSAVLSNWAQMSPNRLEGIYISESRFVSTKLSVDF